jgi:hypothetical protein
MARSLAVDMSCGFRGIRRKQRKVKWHPYKLSVTVEIAEVPAVENLTALVVSYERGAKTGPRRKETVRQAVAGHAGALWRPVPGPDYVPRSSFADLEAVARHVYWRQYPFGRNPAGGLPTHTEALAVMREIHKDSGEWARERAARIASDLLLVDDVLHRRDIEPVWMVIPAGKVVEVDFQRPFPGRITSGIPFPIAERERAEEAARRLAEAAGSKVKSSGMRLEVADPAFLSRTCGVSFAQMMAMAFATARNAINRECRGKIPQALQERYDAFAKAILPGGDVCEAAALLDGLEQAIADFSAFDGPDYSVNGAVRSPLGGGWRRCAEAALSIGAIHDIFGGETMRPELEAEDDFALSSLGV